MLPWIFAILVLLNVGFFFWGYQREKSLEPPQTPVPGGSYEIWLVDELQEEPRPPGANRQDAQAQVKAGNGAIGDDLLEDESATPAIGGAHD